MSKRLTVDKIEINGILEKVATPIYQIEIDLGMPKTTLQKAIKGERVLPKKWALKLIEAFPKKEEVVPPPIIPKKELTKEEPAKLSMKERIAQEMEHFLKNKNK